MHKAMIVGIDEYAGNPLSGCVKDAQRVDVLLSQNEDDSPNYETMRWCAPADAESRLPTPITTARLRKAAQDFFAKPAEVGVFYFAGHGVVNALGGYLVTQDATRYDAGFPMFELLTMANDSPIHEVVIVLDCCKSGTLGAIPGISEKASAFLRSGVTVLSACDYDETAAERNQHGVFTTLFCDALEGGGADVCGTVTVSSVYTYIDRALGAFEQRPLFKANLHRSIPLRTCKPAVPRSVLRLLPTYFRSPGDIFSLDPSYEPEVPPPDPAHESVFAELQKLRDARLLVPHEAKSLYHAAILSKGCRLTTLGRWYWHLAKTRRI